MSDQITYVFKDDKTYAVRYGKVIAADTDPAEVERQVKLAYGEAEMGDPYGGLDDGPDYGYGEGRAMGEDPYHPDHEHICQGCGGNYQDPDGQTPCPHCGQVDSMTQGLNAPGGFGEELAQGLGMAPQAPMQQPHNTFSKVITPNGLHGTVLGKVAGLWGDEVTVRLENGRIVKLPTGTELHAGAQPKTAAAPDPVTRLEHRLASAPVGTRESLSERLRELAWLKDRAATMIREGVSHNDAQRLDTIAVTADVERSDVVDAIAYIDSVEAIEAPRAFTIQAADRTSSISREDGSWLDDTYEQMIREAAATDFTKLMDEGPEAFAAELPDTAIADTGVTRQLASHFIAEKTAGVVRQIAEPYMDTFLARVEECRRVQLSTRHQANHKEAAAAEDKYKDLPDDVLFL